MSRPISAWTERHSATAVALAGVSSAMLAGVLEPRPWGVVLAAVVIVVAAVSLALDAFGGIAVGLFGAAAMTAAKRLAGAWSSDGFTLALWEVTALITVGVLVGRLGERLRPASVDTPMPASLDPAYGSLGLLDADLGRARLEEEVDRARRHNRPLTLLVIESRITDTGLPSDGIEMALRSVARILESRLRGTDVPFALSRERLAAILPETGRAGAWQVAGPLLDAVASQRFTARSDGRERTLRDCIELAIGLAVLDVRARSAAGMLDLAIAGLGAPEDDPPGTPRTDVASGRRQFDGREPAREAAR